MLASRFLARRLNGLVAQRCGGFHSSVYLLGIVVENVPVLGESITEGSVASWAKKIGDRVEVDDVVVVIETDKVTVDVKATRSGVLMKQLAKDTVFVGKPLYEIQADANGSAPVATKAVDVPAPAQVSVDEESKAHHTARTPMIKFVGKRDHKKSEIKDAPTHPAPVTPTADSPRPWLPKKPQTGVDFTLLKDAAWHGRPKLSPKEMDAIMSGGAY